MGEIKSARELALEKTARLGKLTPEEIKQQKEEKRKNITDFLLNRYLGGLSISQFEVEINKYSGEEMLELKKRLALKLLEKLSLEDSENLSRAVEGLVHLLPGQQAGKIVGEINNLFSEWEQVEKGKTGEMERIGREALHQLRISGSAIARINVRGNVLWRKALDELARPYQSRLDDLKRQLNSAVGAL